MGSACARPDDTRWIGRTSATLVLSLQGWLPPRLWTSSRAKEGEAQQYLNGHRVFAAARTSRGGNSELVLEKSGPAVEPDSVCIGVFANHPSESHVEGHEGEQGMVGVGEVYIYKHI